MATNYYVGTASPSGAIKKDRERILVIEFARSEYWEKRGPKRRTLPATGLVQKMTLADLQMACSSPRGDGPGRRTSAHHLLSRNGGGVPAGFGT